MLFHLISKVQKLKLKEKKSPAQSHPRDPRLAPALHLDVPTLLPTDVLCKEVTALSPTLVCALTHVGGW